MIAWFAGAAFTYFLIFGSSKVSWWAAIGGAVMLCLFWPLLLGLLAHDLLKYNGINVDEVMDMDSK